MSIFCYGERDMQRQDSEWRLYVSGEDSAEKIDSLKRRGSFGSMSIIARAFALLLTPAHSLLPFYVPVGTVSFSERPLLDFRGMFVSGMNARLMVFSAEVLAHGYVEVQRRNLLDSGHVARYEILFREALSVLPPNSVQAFTLRALQKKNSSYRQAFQS